MIRCQALQWGPPRQPLTPPLNLQLASGSLTAIIGANGCGKSSLLKVIAGLQPALQGRIEVAANRLGGLAYLQQQQALDRQFPVDLQQLVGAGLWRSQLPRRTRQLRLAQALADWQLSGLERRPLQALSGGELQRALLARLGLTDARLLLLDEPAAALDEAGQRLLWQQIGRWQEQGRTQLVVCHDLAQVREHIPSTLHITAAGCVLATSAQPIGAAQPMADVA
ncbi:MAG: metal ABC transporter ATP-binding protein [Pseudomonas sp.]